MNNSDNVIPLPEEPEPLAAELNPEESKRPKKLEGVIRKQNSQQQLVPYLPASECTFLDHELDEKRWLKLRKELSRIRRAMIAMYRRHPCRYIGEGYGRKPDPKGPKAILKRRIEALFSRKPNLDSIY